MPLSLFGQKHYEEGFVILNNQDTIYGLVKDRKPYPFARLYKKIRFKGKRGRSKYGPNKILGYRKGQNSFESIWIKEPRNFFSQNYTSTYGLGEIRFLKIVEKGYLTYYQMEFEDADSGNIDTINLFKKKDDDKLIKLSLGIFGFHRKRLIRFLNECPPLVKKIERKEFKFPYEIANFYNTWKSEQLK